MVKKILPFLCSLAPFYAFGADSIIIPTNPATIDIGNNKYANISSGIGVTVTGTVDIGGNLMVLNTATPQTPTVTNGDLYILNTAGNASGLFGITSGGDLTVVGNVSVAETRGLKLSGAVDMSVGGDVLSTGSFAVEGANTLDISGAITSADSLSLQAGQIDIDGNISQNSFGANVAAANKKLNIETTSGAMAIGEVSTVAQVATITSATTITSSGAIQNSVGNMTITSSGNFSTVGSVENNGNKLVVNTGNGTMSVGGTLNNTLGGGELDITAGALSALSFVNVGDATLNITGATTFTNGMNLSGMAATSELSLTTGTLSLGTNTLIANNKSGVGITVTGGALNAGSVVNGVLNGDSNDSAIMNLQGVGVTLVSVQNYGHLLTIDTTNSTDDITISGSVAAAATTQTDITADDVLTISGAVSNSGDMLLSGQSVNLTSVTNTGSGAVLDVLATASGASIHITGGITNTNGTTTIDGQNVTLDGFVKNESGTLNITDAGTLSMPSIALEGGVVNVNSLAGSVSVGTLNITGGVLNLGGSVLQFNAASDISVGGNIYVAASSTTGNKDVRLTGTGGNINFVSNGALSVTRNIIATDASARRATFDGTTISANGVNVQNAGYVQFGTDANSTLGITGALSATNGGIVEIYSGTVTAGTITESGNGLIKMHSGSLVANAGSITINNGISFDGSTTAIGLVIDDALNAFTLNNSQNNSDMTIGGGVSIGAGNVLTLNSAHNTSVSGVVNIDGKLAVTAGNSVAFNNTVTNNGDAATSLVVNAKSIALAGLTNSASAELVATNGTITSTASIINSDSLTASATGNISLTDLTSNAGNVTLSSSAGNVTATGALSVIDGNVGVTGNIVTLNALDLDGGITTITGGQKLVVNNGIDIAGNLVQGTATDVASTGGMLKLADTGRVEAASLNITAGEFIAKSVASDYVISGAANFGNAISVANGAMVNVTASSIETSGDVTNNGILSLVTTGAATGINAGNIINNLGLTIDTNGLLTATSFTNSENATATITSNNMNLTGPSNIQKALNIAHDLYQSYTGPLANGDVNIVNNSYEISASGVSIGGNMNQYGSAAMVINSSDVTVGGDINATNLQIKATPATTWSNIKVGGNLSSGVKIYGLEHMTVGGNYTFDDTSLLHVAVLPYATGVVLNSTIYNYWADVSLNDDSSLGQITNRDNNPNNALIHVDGNFISNISSVADAPDGAAMVAPQIGITLYDVVDQGSAIWLLYAENGLNDLATKIRNLNVNFCNSDGSICFNYFDALSPVANADNNGTSDDLPIYLSVRDYDNDGTTDSLYIIFDPRFGGVVTVLDTESIVDRMDSATDGEKSAAGAIDDMIAGQLADAGFAPDAPIEAIPLAFAGTNLSDLANELYNRMEQYSLTFDGTPLKNMARLIQPRELEQVTSSIALNEHTSFRDFEDHMFNEFIWNRNRSLNQVWFDADFGMFRQNGSDAKTISGNRFNITAGFDWQNSTKTILGLMARVSHMSSDNSDNIDLSYKPGETIAGHNSMTVADTNIGFGGYLMHALGFKTRVYGNAMIDAHLLDVSREQNYVDDISGNGTAFSLISELGLMHDWLNQYIVGNLYARFGYNFGFSIKEKSADDDYMQLKSDGYFLLTPGYSLIAQKRIYTSPWFQIRPYASIGVEYDVLGAPDVAKYKFAPADKYSKYNIDNDPFWANIGGGLEMLSANGLQFGLDYRYQYNNYIQLHNIKLSGSLRF